MRQLTCFGRHHRTRDLFLLAGVFQAHFDEHQNLLRHFTTRIEDINSMLNIRLKDFILNQHRHQGFHVGIFIDDIKRIADTARVIFQFQRFDMAN